MPCILTFICILVGMYLLRNASAGQILATLAIAALLTYLTGGFGTLVPL